MIHDGLRGIVEDGEALPDALLVVVGVFRFGADQQTIDHGLVAAIEIHASVAGFDQRLKHGPLLDLARVAVNQEPIASRQRRLHHGVADQRQHSF